MSYLSIHHRRCRHHHHHHYYTKIPRGLHFILRKDIERLMARGVLKIVYSGECPHEPR